MNKNEEPKIIGGYSYAFAALNMVPGTQDIVFGEVTIDFFLLCTKISFLFGPFKSIKSLGKQLVPALKGFLRSELGTAFLRVLGKPGR